MNRRLSHVIGVDDGPFDRDRRDDVLIIGAVFSGMRLEGVLSDKVCRDGTNATRVLINMISRSRFAAHVQVIMLQGVTVAGFNVIDLSTLYRTLQVPVITVVRRAPNLAAVRQALLTRVPGGRLKWELIQRSGPVEAVAGVFVQRLGISLTEADTLIRRLAVNSMLPEPLRTAHLIAGGISVGESRHRA
jgi:endonuclease V-like protein UPF0215 family